MKNQECNTKRDNNYDLLRIICSIAVIIIHISATYKDAITNECIFGSLYKSNVFTILLYNTLSRFAVPCFVMLSGAFLLDDDRNGAYRYFYKKSMMNVGIPTVTFSILYFCYSELIICAKIIIKGDELSGILKPIKDVVQGAPFYHMWYLYMLIGVYLSIPIIIKLKNDIGERKFRKLAYIFLFVSTISGWTTVFSVNWSTTQAVCYLGYLLMGYEIRHHYGVNKNNVYGIFFIVLGVVTEILLTVIQYDHSMRGLSEADEKYSVVGNFNPLVVLASVLIFLGVTKMRIRYSFVKLSAMTFNIYLIHAGVWSLLSMSILKKIVFKVNCTVVIPMAIIVVFIISYFISIVYDKIWAMFDRRFDISSGICKFMKLG